MWSTRKVDSPLISSYLESQFKVSPETSFSHHHNHLLFSILFIIFLYFVHFFIPYCGYFFDQRWLKLWRARIETIMIMSMITMRMMLMEKKRDLDTYLYVHGVTKSSIGDKILHEWYLDSVLQRVSLFFDSFFTNLLFWSLGHDNSVEGKAIKTILSFDIFSNSLCFLLVIWQLICSNLVFHL